MLRCNHVIALSLACCLCAACGGAPPPAVVEPDSKDERDLEPLDLPESIRPQEVARWEKRLLLLPESHPSRRPLRELVAQHYAREFSSTPAEEIDERLDVFRDAIALNAPVDFQSREVSPAVVPMARWLVEVFRQRGNESLVLAGHRYLMLAEPDEVRHEQRYRELSEWSETARRVIEDEMERLTSLIGMYEGMVRLVPDREVVDRLGDLLLQRHAVLLSRLEQVERSSGSVPAFLLRAVLQEGGMAKDMIHIYFLAGDTGGALDRMRELSARSEIGGEYVDLLEDIEAERDVAENYFALAGLIGADDPGAGLRACVLARAEDEQDPRYPLCAGRFLERLDRYECAVDFYVEAARISPAEEVVTQVMELVRVAMYELHRRQNLEASRRVVDVADELVRRFLKSGEVESEELRAASASLLFTAGEVEFDDGYIEVAEKLYERTRQLWPEMVLSLMKIARIRHLRGENDRAVELIDEALKMEDYAPGGDPSYWRALLYERRGGYRVDADEEKLASSDLEQALAEWKTATIPPSQEPEAAVRQGVLHDRLGDPEASEQSFRRAVRLDPDRQATYAEVISHLVMSERLEDAKAFYRLAYNQDQIEAMWKIYYSLWVEGLALRKSGESFDLARGYLEQSEGESWQDQLARQFTGRISAEELRAAAANKGELAEADFYVALRSLAEGGDEKRARSLLKSVLESDLMGFFEYKMARGLLGAGGLSGEESRSGGSD
jgi:tetratricopeptide (TPR) repeat protein